MTAHTRRIGLTTVAILLLSTVLPTFGDQATAVARPQVAPRLPRDQPFQARVLQGPDRGMVLSGSLTLRMGSSGNLTGTLRLKSGTVVAVTGQVKGQLIGLFFNLATGKNIFGTGVIGYDRFQKKHVIGGTFTGPRDTSMGVWEYASQTAEGGCLIGISTNSSASRPGLCYIVK